MKKNKSIGLTKDTRRDLTLQAIELDIDLKLHCENILEKAAKDGVATKPVEKVIPTSKPKKAAKDLPEIKTVKKDYIEKEEVEKNVAETPQEDNVAEILPTDKSLFDTSGVFKQVEPKIYANKKCFEFRHFTMDNGVVKYYFKNLEEAQFAKNNPEDIV